ncbi:MAG: hypothetical protein HC772_15530 [Leptolyngbyaceae cyanobacterium CRU_2_3]|nr:hypothetical protein [Leptolyngbyaceae cyanobacterium CRU_2_3]
MQYLASVSNATAVKTAAAWEYTVPNGQYSVTVSAGDQGPYDSQNVIRVEGVTAIASFQGNSIQEYELGTVLVNVTMVD